MVAQRSTLKASAVRPKRRHRDRPKQSVRSACLFRRLWKGSWICSSATVKHRCLHTPPDELRDRSKHSTRLQAPPIEDVDAQSHSCAAAVIHPASSSTYHSAGAKLETSSSVEISGDACGSIATHGGGVVGPLAITQAHSGWLAIIDDRECRSFAAHRQGAFHPSQLKNWFRLCSAHLPWRRPNAVIPRGAVWLVSHCCECPYKYAAASFPPTQMADWFVEMTYAVCKACGVTEPPNSCNANFYGSGMESVGWHADDEAIFKATQQDALIVSLSLGATRRFEFRPHVYGSGKLASASVILKDGDLCTMEGLCQKHYLHCVPKQPEVCGPRINLTWRWIVQHDVVCPLAKSGALGQKLRDLAEARNRLRWLQQQRLEQKASSEQELAKDHAGTWSSASSMQPKIIQLDDKSKHSGEAQLLQERLAKAREQLAEMKRKRMYIERQTAQTDTQKP